MNERKCKSCLHVMHERKWRTCMCDAIVCVYIIYICVCGVLVCEL